MEKYKEKKFNIGELKGMSKKSIDEHLKLYAGYVKHTNLILDKINELKGDDNNSYALSEMRRRFSFEFDGMRNHEIYFKSLETGSSDLREDSKLYKKIIEDFGSFDSWINDFKTLSKTRGIGWAILYYDKENNTLLNNWSDEQHLGHLTGLTPILALDMWEHSFVLDYLPSGKGDYINDFFDNLNWNVIEENFDNA